MLHVREPEIPSWNGSRATLFGLEIDLEAKADPKRTVTNPVGSPGSTFNLLGPPKSG